MRFAATIALFVLSFGGTLVLALRARPRPLPLALPIAWALLMVYEGLLLPLLSFGRLVTPAGLVFGHVPLVAVCVLGVRRGGARTWRAARFWAARPPLLHAALVLLASAVLASALSAPPNTWDAMSYHLARVAHWIANGSVRAYSSWIPRQNFFPPGAEYFLLVPQAMTESDRLAPFAQLASWGILVVSAPALARCFGAPRRLAPFAALLVATLPMGVLQAASTQNDLVAASMAAAVVIAALPLAHRRRPSWASGAAFGAAISAAALVKASALVAAVPFVGWALLAGSRGRAIDVAGRVGRLVLAAAPPAVLVALAEVARRRPYGFPAVADRYTYPLVGEWPDRLAHSLRAIGHHLPISDALGRLSPLLVSKSESDSGFLARPFRFCEDFVGNPGHAALFLVAIAVLLWRWRVLPRRARAGVLSLAAGWVVLHALARENAWFSRLETPLFTLGGIGLAVLSGVPAPRARQVARAFAVAAVPLAGYALAVILGNEMRPLLPTKRMAQAGYYLRKPKLEPLDDAVLALAKARGCDRLGFMITPAADSDAWEYPVVWRARAEGIRVEHVNPRDSWPCVLQYLGPPLDPAVWRSPNPALGIWERVH